MRPIKRISVLLVGLAAIFVSAPALAASFHIDLDPLHTKYGNLKQTDVSGCAGDPQGLVACGPTAATNSFAFLQREYPEIYDTSLIPDTNFNGMIDYSELVDVADILAGPGYMGCCAPGGTRHDDFIFGKQKYLEEKVPGGTVYAAQDPFPWNNPLRPRPDYVQPVNPTFGFLFGELQHGEDVEILINGDFNHYLTLSSLDWDDADNDGIIEMVESAMMDFIDPATGAKSFAKIWQDALGGIIHTDYGGGASVSDITVAVGESPIPEPTTMLLVGSGLLVAVWRRRRRQAIGLSREN